MRDTTGKTGIAGKMGKTAFRWITAAALIGVPLAIATPAAQAQGVWFGFGGPRVHVIVAPPVAVYGPGYGPGYAPAYGPAVAPAYGPAYGVGYDGPAYYGRGYDRRDYDHRDYDDRGYYRHGDDDHHHDDHRGWR
jgi:hypothetical protein